MPPSLSRLADVMNSANAAELKLRNDLRLSLLKMPKKIRTMPLHDFTRNFNENIKDAMMVDVDSKHDRLLLMLAEMNANGESDAAAGANARATRTVRKTARKAPARGRTEPALDEMEGAANDDVVPMTVTRTTRKRKAATSVMNTNENEMTTTLRRSTRTRSRTATAAANDALNSMVTPMPTRGGVGRTPFSNAGNKVALTPGIVPGSASRMPKMGEVFFSKNGASYSRAFTKGLQDDGRLSAFLFVFDLRVDNPAPQSSAHRHSGVSD